MFVTKTVAAEVLRNCEHLPVEGKNVLKTNAQTTNQSDVCTQTGTLFDMYLVSRYAGDEGKLLDDVGNNHHRRTDDVRYGKL